MLRALCFLAKGRNTFIYSMFCLELCYKTDFSFKILDPCVHVTSIHTFTIAVIRKYVAKTKRILPNVTKQNLTRGRQRFIPTANDHFIVLI